MPQGERPLTLFVTPVLPWPGRSGLNLRAWAWLTELAQDGDVHVLLTAKMLPPLPENYPAARVWAVESQLWGGSSLMRRLGFILPPLVLLSRRFGADQQVPLPGAFSIQAKALAGAPVVRIVVFRDRLAALGTALGRLFPGASVELDLDDLESMSRLSVAGAALRLGRLPEALRGALLGVQYWLLERAPPRGFTRVYVTAREDCNRLGGTAAVARPNRLHAVAPAAPAPAEGPLHVLFVGSLHYPPNEEGVRFLARQVVPALRRRLARPWRLVVVGRNASPGLLRLLDGIPEVDFAGEGGELAGHYAAAHAVLVPIRTGGGTKFKTIEGLAHRRAVVSTRHGVRGLGAEAGRHYLAAETPDEFAAAIAELAADETLRERIAAAGHALFMRELRLP